MSFETSDEHGHANTCTFTGCVTRLRCCMQCSLKVLICFPVRPPLFLQFENRHVDFDWYKLCANTSTTLHSLPVIWKLLLERLCSWLAFRTCCALQHLQQCVSVRLLEVFFFCMWSSWGCKFKHFFFFKLQEKGWMHYSLIKAHVGSLTLTIWLSYRVVHETFFDCDCISGNGYVEAIKSPKETSERKFCSEEGCEPRNHLPVCAALLSQTSFCIGSG